MKSLVPLFALCRALAIGVLGVAALAAQTPDLDHWTWRNPLPQGNALRGVTWNGTQFVAVGDGGTILASADGVNWTSRSLGKTNFLRGVVWGGNRFVAVGDRGTILISGDGVSWRESISGWLDDLTSVTWGGNQFVAVGSGGIVITSPDGMSWTRRPADTGLYLIGVTWGGSLFVVVGDGGTILTSTDGISWMKHQASGTLFSVAWSGSQFVAVGEFGTLFTSTDGVNWTSQSPGTRNALSSVTWSGNQFVVVGEGGTILTSANGVSWISGNANTTSFLNGVTWNGSQLVAIGDAGTIITSTNGTIWTSRSRGTTNHLYRVTWSGSGFVIVGGSGTIMTSPDGANWASRNAGTANPLSGLAWSGSQFVAVGSSGTILTSLDGVTWTSRTSGTTDDLSDVTWSGNQFVAVGGNYMRVGTILTSADGVIWTARSNGAADWLKGVAGSGSQYVAVGDFGKIVTSPDGAVWTARTSGVANFLRGVNWNGSQFVAVGDSGVILTSPDGVIWTSGTSGTTNDLGDLLSVMWNGSQFVATCGSDSLAVLDSRFLTSPDGVNWTGHFAGTTNALCCVAWSGSQFVAVGASGTILTASNMLVPAAPVITTQPQSLTATVRSNIGISTIASGTPEPTYQWQKNGAAISGAIASTLTLTNVQMSDAGAYSVKASNSAGSVTSNVATLTVNAPISPPYFVTASSSQTVVIGRSAIFQVFAGGEPPFTYQWLKNGTAIAGATSATLGFGSVQASDAGAYSVILSNSGGSITSSPDILMVKTSPFAPGIAAQPASQAVTTGANVTFTVAASGSGTLSYQWQKDGTAITGATGASYSITTTLPADAGSYTCVVTNSAGSSTSAAGTLTVYPSRLANLSVRAPAGAGDQTLILGFYIGGTGSKQVLIRGVGPTLAQYGVSGVLADPQLKLFNVANVQINQNDNWGGGTALANAFTAVNDFALPANSKDAALLVTLPLDGYTAQVNSADTSTGVAMIEAYETDTGTPGARFTALSARNQVGMGDNILIAGFVVTGNAPKTLLIRGIGPTLANYGVSGVLADPQLALFDGTSTKIAGNDNWGGTTALSDAFTATQAFPLPATSKDAALLVTLQPGLYSAQISGVGGTTGVALVEVYEVP